MATNIVVDKLLLSCKKCGGEHQKPVGSKCDRPKIVKEEKRDSSRDTSVKKTPRGKVNKISSQDKVLEMVMSTMNSFSEKLSAMEERLSNIATPVDGTRLEKCTTRKSRSREKIKRIEISDDDEKPTVLSPSQNIVHGQDGTAFLKVFPDTAVAVKSLSTPARHKKQHGDCDLGVTPLFMEPPSVQGKPVVKNPLPRVTSTILKPQDNVTTWEAVSVLNVPDATTQLKTDTRDMNHNVLSYTDQYGNPVQIQAPVQMEVVNQGTYPVSESLAVSGTGTLQQQSIESLCSNPVIQQLVEECVALLETHMKTELHQGNVLRKKSGRYNTADTPCGPAHTRWPNESYPVGVNRK